MTYKNKKEINQNVNLSKNWVINQMNQIERNQKEPKGAHHEGR